MKILAVCALLAPLAAVAQNPPATPPTFVQRIGGDVAQSHLVTRVEPEYPALAQAARIQDYVMLQVQLGKDGKVTSASVLRGHPLLNDAALNAVRRWEYKPLMLAGVPIEVVTTVTVNFKLPFPNAPILPAGNATIAGTLRHADGRPAASAVVLAVAVQEGNTGSAPVSVLIQTDSAGAYRIDRLPAGVYHVLAGTGVSSLSYYPGVADARNAVAVTVATGQTSVVGIDFPIP